MAKKESALQTAAAHYLRSIGAYGNINHGSAFSGSGRPDSEWCYHGLYVAFEFKTPKGRLRPEQVAHLQAIRKAGGEAYVATTMQHVRDVIAHLDEALLAAQ